MAPEFIYIECGCSSSDHVLRAWVDDEITNNPMVWVEAYSHRNNLWWRIKIGLKYLLTGQMPHEWVWDRKSLPGLYKVIEGLEGNNVKTQQDS